MRIGPETIFLAHRWCPSFIFREAIDLLRKRETLERVAIFIVPSLHVETKLESMYDIVAKGIRCKHSKLQLRY